MLQLEIALASNKLIIFSFADAPVRNFTHGRHPAAFSTVGLLHRITYLLVSLRLLALDDFANPKMIIVRGAKPKRSSWEVLKHVQLNQC